VKNGIVRVGEKEELFTEWLGGLRDERWPKAWENFWRNEGFLKDIGMEA